MLSRAAFALTLLLVGLVLVGVPSANADDPSCPGGRLIRVLDPATGQFTLKWVCPGTPGDSGGDAGGGVAVKCFYLGNEIPCDNNGSPWSAKHSCWVTPVDPQDPPPEGKKNEDGDWYYCTPPPPFIVQGAPPKVWIEEPPTTFVNPAELAARAVAAMDLEPIGIGMVPESGPDRMGLIGLPVWMWVDNPAANTYGPITKSASEGGVTVTATATVAEVLWDMGDGSEPISCGAGTPYADHYGNADSPTCGHHYQLTSADEPKGAYRVTATSYWVIEWVGGGMTGTIEFDLSNTANVRVGEAQVLTQ